MKLFFAKINNQDILLHSSSGGVFWALSKYVIKNNGVVFGACWNKEWLVDISYSTNLEGCKKFMTSKYVLANIKDSYSIAKKFLDDGRLVLFTGISCQNFGLLKYLNKKYKNLILVDVACHGLPSVKMWKDYLLSINTSNNKINNINFRDKTSGWENYRFKLTFENGKTIDEFYYNNKYMRFFLGDNYLRECCYNCKYKNKNSCADLIIGDFWTISKVNPDLYDKHGSSFIITNTKKGEHILSKINNYILVEEIAYSGDVYNFVGLANIIDKKRLKYSSEIFEKRVGIINNTFQSNMGGIIQTYALQQTLKELGYKSVAYNANFPWSKRYLKFIDNYIKVFFIGDFPNQIYVPFENAIRQDDVSALIIGSDQIWRKECNNINNIFLNFASGWKINKVTYAASMAVDKWNYNQYDNALIKQLITQFTGVSVREINLVKQTKKYIGIKPKLVLDPAMLLNKEHYDLLCKKIKSKKGIFAYILDYSEKIDKAINFACHRLNKQIYKYDEEILEDWLAGFRDADLVITDSFHGCVFSIIYNKPFICIKNYERGVSRFDSLEKIFKLKGRFINDISELNEELLFVKPECNKIIKKYKKKSIKFLKHSLSVKPRIVENNLKQKIKCLLVKLYPINTKRGRIARSIYRFLKSLLSKATRIESNN